MTKSEAGKGDTPRPVDKERWGLGWLRIDRETVRRRINAGESLGKIAREYGVGENQVSAIINEVSR